MFGRINSLNCRWCVGVGILHKLVGNKGKGKGGGGRGYSASTGGKQGGRKGWRDTGVLHQLVGNKPEGRGGGTRVFCINW